MWPTAPILYIPKGKLGNIGGTFLSVEIEWEWNSTTKWYLYQGKWIIKSSETSYSTS